MTKLRTILLVGAILTSALSVFRIIQYFTRRKTGNVAPNSFGTFAAFVALNFCVFWWVATLSGGDALNGKIVGNEYFLADHGRYTSVSFGFWLYSLTHTWVTILSFLALFLWLIIGSLTGRVAMPTDGDDLHPRGRGTV